jgi:hypothetical protein
MWIGSSGAMSTQPIGSSQTNSATGAFVGATSVAGASAVGGASVGLGPQAANPRLRITMTAKAVQSFPFTFYLLLFSFIVLLRSLSGAHPFGKVEASNSVVEGPITPFHLEPIRKVTLLLLDDSLPLLRYRQRRTVVRLERFFG